MSEEKKNDAVTNGEEWTAERAFADIVSALENPEDYTDQITAVNSSFKENDPKDSTEIWKDRYERLRDDYRRRFIEDTLYKSSTVDDKDDEDVNNESISIDDLDFNGMTE